MGGKGRGRKGNATGECKWCEQGQCWDHGQIEKTEENGATAKQKKVKASAANGAGKGPAQLQALFGGDTKKLHSFFGAVALLKGGKGLDASGGKGTLIMNALAGAGGGGGRPDHSNTSWKQTLNLAYLKANKKDLTKTDCVYEVNLVSEKPSSFQAIVTIDGQAYAGEAAESKKKAEDMAAKQAFTDLYPDQTGGPVGGFAGFGGGLADSLKALLGGHGGESTGKKRKAEKQKVEMDPRQLLNHGASLALGRSLTKADITIETTGSLVEGFSSTVSVPAMSETPFQGSGPSQKEATSSALEAALEGLKAEIDAAVAAHAEKKAAKNKASLTALKLLHDEKKAAKKAAAAEVAAA